MENLATTRTAHVLPALPYALDALEPHIDARTMALHHGKHHAGYVANLNAALEGHAELRERTAEWLMRNPDRIPDKLQTAVRRNAGGHVNHSMLWQCMAPASAGNPSGALADAIRRDFGSIEQFMARFNDAGEKAFGSAWVWLARSRINGGKLSVLTTPGHENPLMQGLVPVLVNDVWEHAYYLKHENRRGDYLKGWWAVVNWKEAERRFAASGPAA
jgi:Fe-Mn family superoxide dismutase